MKCLATFQTLKDKLVSKPIIVALDWSEEFELMSDANDYAVGIVLGQRQDKIFHAIYSKDLLLLCASSLTITSMAIPTMHLPLSFFWVLLFISEIHGSSFLSMLIAFFLLFLFVWDLRFFQFVLCLGLFNCVSVVVEEKR